MMVSCGRCGKMHPRGYKCNYGRTYDAERTEEDKLRYTRRWQNKAKQIKADANYLCEYCKQQGVYNYSGLEVHHITKLREDPSGLLDDENLICLCLYHHRQADNGDIAAEDLRKIARDRVRHG